MTFNFFTDVSWEMGQNMRTNTLTQNVRFKVVLDTRRYQIIRIKVYYNQYHFTGLEFSNLTKKSFFLSSWKGKNYKFELMTYRTTL